MVSEPCDKKANVVDVVERTNMRVDISEDAEFNGG